MKNLETNPKVAYITVDVRWAMTNALKPDRDWWKSKKTIL
jgi:hypothetical protein